MAETGMNFPVEDNATIIDNLQKFAAQDPDRAAFIFVDKDLNQRVITRQNVWDISRKFATVLKRLGLGKGDIVCNTLVNSPERLLTDFGTLASGATPSQGQLFLADGSDLIHNLKESKSKAIIYDPLDESGARRILENIKYADVTTRTTKYKDLPDLTQVIEIEAKGLEESDRWIHVIDREEEMFVDESISEDDTAMIFVTSGTTGFSKLVSHSHKNLLYFSADFIENGCYSRETVLFNSRSLGWIGGFPRRYVRFGCKRVIIDQTNGLPDNMSIGAFIITVCNMTCVNNASLSALDVQNCLDAHNEGLRIHAKLDVISTAGGPVYNVTMEAIGRITKKLMVIYGSTEMIVACVNPITNISDFQETCSGRPVNCEVKVVGEYGKELPVEVQGEILVRSRHVFKGYINNPAKTAEAITEDSWYKTGDIGYFNKDGQLFVLCRKADAITKDSFTHYPGWMEKLINKHPDIKATVVIGIPDPVHHEEICLCMKLMPGAKVSIEDMREYCKNLFLTDQDDKMTPLPRYYLIFDEFIVNNNGKVDRKKMREEALKRLKVDYN